MLKGNKLFNQVGGWRLRSKPEATDFIENFKKHMTEEYLVNSKRPQ